MAAKQGISTMIEMLTALFQLSLSISQKIPDWKQRKKDEYAALLKNIQTAQDHLPHDNNMIDYNVEQLRNFLTVYIKEVQE